MIPPYHFLMLPFLKLLGDNKEHSFRTLIQELATQFDLTEMERNELLPSGKQGLFDNRVSWAKTYLKKAGLLDSPRRGTYKITRYGMATLAEAPPAIDVRYLRRFPSFVEFQAGDGAVTKKADEVIMLADRTPEEILDSSFQIINEGLAAELLEKVLEISPKRFERLVVELIVKMGYGGSVRDAGEAIGKTGDEGIDGTIKEDRLGLDVIYIQAKRWKPGNTIGRPEIQKFVGALAGKNAKKGIFITTSSFTMEAVDYISKIDSKIALLDGKQLSQLMIEFSLGCSVEEIYEVKKIDSDFFSEE